eukprot:scaffold22854_cov132-Isochrysis_galbana.AAC.1
MTTARGWRALSLRRRARASRTSARKLRIRGTVGCTCKHDGRGAGWRELDCASHKLIRRRGGVEGFGRNSSSLTEDDERMPASRGGPAGEGSLQPFVDVLSLERPVVRLAGRRSVKARTDQDESGRGALEAEAEGRLAAPQKGAVPLHQPKVLVNVDSGKPDHRRQLARQRLPLWRKLLARLRPIVIELEQPRLAKALGQVGVVLRGQRQSLGEDGRPARPASSEWVVEVVPPLLLCLPTDAGIVVSVQIILTALLWIGECFICSCHALEPSLRVRAFVLVWMVVSSQLAVRRLDLRL